MGIVVQNDSIIHAEDPSHVRGDGKWNPLDLKAHVLVPWLFQSHPHSGSASAVVVDQNSGRPARILARKKKPKRFPCVLADLDHLLDHLDFD